MPLVKSVAEPLLAEFKEFDYDNLKKMMEEWRGNIDKEIERIYEIPENSNIPKLRESKMRNAEETEVSSEKTDEDVRKQNDDVTKLARFMDFVGNMIKNYSGEMSNDFRNEVIDFIFNSAGRIIGSFCSFSTYIVDKLICMIEEKIEKGDEDIINAKSEVPQLIKYLFSEILMEFIGESFMIFLWIIHQRKLISSVWQVSF